MIEPRRRSRRERQVIVVEGVNDKHVITHLLDRSGRAARVEVIDHDGLDKLLGGIRALVGSAENRVIGIIVDANDKPLNRKQAVIGQLSRSGVEVPEDLDSNGTIIPETDTLPRIGIWMMPDNVSTGELEHFVAAMIPDDDPIWPRAEAYIEGIPAVHRAFRPQKETRAKVLSWIATREEPGFMGQAISRGDLRTDGELCQRFIAWLDRLFVEAGDVVDAK